VTGFVPWTTRISARPRRCAELSPAPAHPVAGTPTCLVQGLREARLRRRPLRRLNAADRRAGPKVRHSTISTWPVDPRSGLWRRPFAEAPRRPAMLLRPTLLTVTELWTPEHKPHCEGRVVPTLTLRYQAPQSRNTSGPRPSPSGTRTAGWVTQPSQWHSGSFPR